MCTVGKSMLKKCPFLCGCTVMRLPWKAPIALSSKRCLYVSNQEQHQSNGQCLSDCSRKSLRWSIDWHTWLDVFSLHTLCFHGLHMQRSNYPLSRLCILLRSCLQGSHCRGCLLLLFHLLQEYSYIIIFLHTKSRTLTV